MSTSTEFPTVVACFVDGAQVERAVERLHRAGFRDSQIAVRRKGRRGPVLALGTAAGAIVGGLVGTVASGLMGGVGPDRTRLDLAKMLRGAGVGALLGGLIGAADGMATSDGETLAEVDGLVAGLDTVVVRAGDRHADAEEILRNAGAYRVLHRYRERRAGLPQVGYVFGQDGEIRIPVFEERVELERVPVVTQEVHIRKRTVEEAERISDTVQREEISIERKGDVEVHRIAGEHEPRGG